MLNVHKYITNRAISNNLNMYVVGGFVRDKILGITPTDIDIVVFGIGEKEFKGMFPACIRTSMAKPVFVIQLEEVWYNIYISEHESLLEDALHRDFTVNCLYQSVLTQEIIDPIGGLEDLKGKILRKCPKDSFKQSPYRAYRLIYLQAKLGFSIDPDTLSDFTNQISSGDIPLVIDEKLWIKFWSKIIVYPHNLEQAMLTMIHLGIAPRYVSLMRDTVAPCTYNRHKNLLSLSCAKVGYIVSNYSSEIHFGLPLTVSCYISFLSTIFVYDKETISGSSFDGLVADFISIVFFTNLDQIGFPRSNITILSSLLNLLGRKDYSSADMNEAVTLLKEMKQASKLTMLMLEAERVAEIGYLPPDIVGFRKLLDEAENLRLHVQLLSRCEIERLITKSRLNFVTNLKRYIEEKRTSNIFMTKEEAIKIAQRTIEKMFEVDFGNLA